jgi:hypothetical protein
LIFRYVNLYLPLKLNVRVSTIDTVPSCDIIEEIFKLSIVLDLAKTQDKLTKNNSVYLINDCAII